MRTIVRWAIIFTLCLVFLVLEIYLEETYAFFDAFFTITGLIVFFSLFGLGLMRAIFDKE